MGSSVIAVILAATPTPTGHVTHSPSAGSNLGPGLPILLALVVIGVVIYLIRQRRRRPPG